MAILNKDKLVAATKSFRALFFEELEQQTPQYKRVAEVVKSDALEEVYNWLKSFPKLKEWIDERQIERLEAAAYTIRKKDWENTIEVDRDEIVYDRLGLVKPRIKALAASVVKGYDELVFGLLSNGFVNKCWDGKPFFPQTIRAGRGWARCRTRAPHRSVPTATRRRARPSCR